jgi:NAD(P)-dependent dehydrogenase (short-subunit alcohol dehydrogenase family)
VKVSMHDVHGRVVLVTGASRGIGRRVALRLARRGARLAVTARSAGDLAKLAAEVRAEGAECEPVLADLTDAAGRDRLVSAVAKRFGGLDVLVNCAGVCSFGEFAASTGDVLRRVMEVNFFAQAELIRVAFPHLLRSSETSRDGWRPAVVNVASICGRWGIPSLPEHCASKHAFVGLTEALRAEFARFDIDVVLVLPGLVRSDDLNRHLLRNEGKIYLDFEGAQLPDAVADDTVRALLKRKAETTSGWVSWGVWWSRRIGPRIVRFFMTRKVWNHLRRERKQEPQRPVGTGV